MPVPLCGLCECAPCMRPFQLVRGAMDVWLCAHVCDEP